MANQNILNFLGQFGGGQSQPLQSPAGFVQQQQGVKLPPYITPTTPTPKGVSPFGDMSKKLDSKSQGLALMLYALGGALKGDKDFVQNTLALQQMQEGKKKQEAQKKKYEEFLAKLPEGSFKDLATTLGPSKLDDLLLERYKAETKEPKERKMVQDAEGYYRYVDTGERVFPGIVKPEKEKTLSSYVADIAKKVQEDPNYELTEQDKRVLAINRKASESAMMLEELQAQALKDINLKDNLSLPTYPSLQAAINAGLKPGDQFKGTDGVTYKIP